MALKLQLGLGGLSARRGQVQVRVEILDRTGDALFAPGGTLFMPGAHLAALDHARYWLRRGNVLVRISDAKVRRARTFRPR